MPTYRALLSGILTLGLLTGCSIVTTPKTTITVDLKQAYASYADIKAVYGLLYTEIANACAAGALSPERCSAAKLIHERARQLDVRVRRSLDNPGVEPDWAAIREIVGALIDLLVL